MLEPFWVWTTDLAVNKPISFGLVVCATMAALGLSCAILADLLFLLLRIDLGKYTKEYEEGGGLH
ncbi:hypothetical protein [Candidatus Desulforudis audaxviator]|uniref:hypothetical protein n=1 Tax=Candidatus Desulforudis audaxviator TaxID=471827 RepID=UPI0002FAF67B|nr:hypothetical protein [Candidatus Desulforudis audaxviator]AZK59121.1 hypothetical protein Daudx_0566 [Candidatus Desulforudis audaxviator]